MLLGSDNVDSVIFCKYIVNVPHGDSDFFLCLTLVTGRKTSFSISLTSFKITISLIIFTIFFFLHLSMKNRSHPPPPADLPPDIFEGTLHRVKGVIFKRNCGAASMGENNKIIWFRQLSC